MNPCFIRRKSSRIRVLGLWIQANGKNTETVNRLESSISQSCRLLKRIANKHAGMREANLLRLVHSFVLSRVTYAVPYLKLVRTEKDKIEILIRKGVKTALGLPPNTSMDKILSLGVSNTLDEMCEAKLVTQYLRLLRSNTGRAILRKLGYAPQTTSKRVVGIPSEFRSTLRIPPIPRNMHPTHNEERRKSRARRLQVMLSQKQGVLYTDVAEYEGSDGSFTAVVADEEGVVVSCCSVRHSTPEKAEEVAVALALVNRNARFIITDSKTAVKTFDTGKVSEAAARILHAGRGNAPTELVRIIWAPAHCGLSGNEQANAAARGLTYRAPVLVHFIPSESGQYRKTDLIT